MKMEQLSSEKTHLLLAFQKLKNAPDMKPIVDWVEKKYDAALLPNDRMPLERLVGQRDVFRDMRKMMETKHD